MVGYVVTAGKFTSDATGYFVYNLVAFCSCAVLLARLNSVKGIYTAVWLGLVIFLVVYIVRFYWIAIDPFPIRVMLPSDTYVDMLRKQPNELFNSFKISVVGFAAFNLCSTFFLFRAEKKNKLNYYAESHLNRELYSRSLKHLLLVVPILILILSYISNFYHIGELGMVSGDPLPFRLKGVIFYARIVVLPLLILLLIFSADRCSRAGMARVGVLFLLIHGGIDMLLRNSRSGLLLCLVLLCFLVLVGAFKLRRWEKISFGCVVLLAIVCVPIITEYRIQQVAYGHTAFYAIEKALTLYGSDFLGTLTKGIVFVFFRMPGIECTWAMLTLDAKPLGFEFFRILSANNGVAGYLTHTIHNGLDPNYPTLLAPGFVGWFYLFAGTPAVMLGAFIASLLATVSWAHLNFSPLRSRPLAQVFFLWMLFLAMTEGTLDSMVYMVLVGALSIVSFEIYFVLIQRRLHVSYQQKA